MNEQKFAAVLELMANGLSLRKAMLQVGVLNGSFFHYLNTVDGAVEQYACARAALLEYWAQDIVEISDDGSRDTITSKDGYDSPDNEWISRSKLRVDSRKWLLSKLMPKVYSDKLALTGEDGKAIRVVLGNDDAAL